jgi:GH15 family glucan-1,4-alpha-glucosidase
VAEAGATAPHSPIGDYGLIGDCETAALVGRDGSIDWLCWPRFDSDACFAAMLGDPSNGRWRIAPAAASTTSRRYRPGSLILETRFETEDGAVTLIDFMPPRGAASDVVRLVRGDSGSVAMRLEMVVRFGYGRTVPWVTHMQDGRLRAVAGPDMVVLQSPVRTHGEDLTTVADFTVEAGQTVPFVLSYQASHLEPPKPIDPLAALAQTEAFWRDWLSRWSGDGPYAEAVERSLITLKALTYAPTGGIVAAPTTSLPEQFGGERNWDYRFCWIRDSTLTLLALMNAGYFEEASAWRDWLLRAVAGAPAQMQIMYGIDGARRLSEWCADWLPGHAGSSPVRIGNAAHTQFQLDVYGELMDTLHQARQGGLEQVEAGWDLQLALIDHVSRIWAEPDEGIWEVRGPRRCFTFSRVMAWVAMDRAVKDAEAYGLEAPLQAWRATRDAIAADVWAKSYDKARNTFTRAYDDPGMDASLLLLPQVGFVEPDHPAFAGTVEAVERELLVDGFVLRYRTDRVEDGLPPGEGAFLACSFWLADAYSMIGRRDDAVALFDRLLSVRNDLGLLAEEYDVAGRRLAGNFPQAFSHVGLINTAANLTRTAKPAQQRAVKAGEPRPSPSP